MEKKLAKVDPNEFGLKEKEAVSIEQAFAPKIAEREGFAKVYEQLITKEIDKSTCAEARELRLKLVKVRTGISDIHKKQKAYFLAAGKFVDAWKNKETLPVTQMEENLTDIEKYYENQEKERVEKLAAEREAEIRKYSEVIPYDLGNMDLEVYENYLTGVKVAMEARIAAEKAAEEERIRLEKIEKLHEDRKNKTIRLVNFIDNYENLSFGEMSEKDFMDIVNGAIKKRTEHEAEQEKIRKENERLKKEAEAKEKALLAEREKVEAERKAAEEKAKKEAEKIKARQSELQPYIVFIRDYNKLLGASDADYKKELAEIKKGAELKWADELKQKLEKEDAYARLEAELKAKIEAELAEQKAKEKEEQERLAEKREAAKAPRKEKLVKWVESFTIPEFENDLVAYGIAKKFEGFKNWAMKEVEKL